MNSADIDKLLERPIEPGVGEPDDVFPGGLLNAREMYEFSARIELSPEAMESDIFAPAVAQEINELAEDLARHICRARQLLVNPQTRSPAA